MHSAIVLKPRVKLFGAGRATVLRKSAVVILYLAQDARKGQDWVILKESPAKLKKGGHVFLADSKRPAKRFSGHSFIITGIEGKTVRIRNRRDGGGLASDLKVANKACLASQFPAINSAEDCVIQDLEIDGNRENRKVLEDAKAFGFWSPYIWYGVYPAGGSGAGVKILRCRVHGFSAGIHVSSLAGSEISLCDISGNKDGIHLGGGPRAIITRNRIHDNRRAGIYFCNGNTRVTITGNHIFRNRTGIDALGAGSPELEYTDDRCSVVSNNFIYANEYAGMSGGQRKGRSGPRDLVITGNVVKDNCLARGRKYLNRGMFRAGIAFYNARGCVIMGNRCLDDQDRFPRRLGRPAAAGEKTLRFGRGSGNYTGSFVQGGWVSVTHGRTQEVRRVARIHGRSLLLATALANSYPAGAVVRGVKTQPWGILALGAQSCDNAIIGNVCAGNVEGGVLWQGSGNVVANNVGQTRKMADKKPRRAEPRPVRGEQGETTSDQ